MLSDSVPPTVIVTGGTSGIGRALAARLAGEYRVIVTGRRDAAASVCGLPKGAVYVQADLNAPDESAAAIEAAFRETGANGLERLIVNAGTGFHARAEDETAAMIRATVAVNLAAPVMLARRFHRYLEAAGGKIVFIGSIAHRGSANMPSYAASKAGIHGLARSLSEEWRGRIAVQVIHPGPTKTPLHDKAGYPGDRSLFFSEQAMADEIARLMRTDRTSATVMAVSALRRLLTGRRWS